VIYTNLFIFSFFIETFFVVEPTAFLISFKDQKLLCLADGNNGFTMTITPDEFKQIVREAVLETMTVKNGTPAEMKYYTRYETCEILQISLSTLDTYVKKGAISCSHLGTRIRFTQDDIDKALAKNRNYKS
jgi:excisionase family DNA binding protein